MLCDFASLSNGILPMSFCDSFKSAGSRAMLCALGLATPTPATSSVNYYPHIVGQSFGYQGTLASYMDCRPMYFVPTTCHLALSSTYR